MTPILQTAADIAAFQSLLSQRLEGVPIAYLVGSREFYGRPFLVSNDVLIPRPDTELLVELALAHLPTDQAVDVLDLGTGSGCIAITLALERPLARVTAVDQSTAALAIAQHNADQLHASVEFLPSDWFAALTGRRFDLIVSNPPYIAAADPHLARGDVRFEPLSALASGQDGLDDLRHLIHAASTHLKPGGTLLLEHGYDQAEAVRNLLHDPSFSRPTKLARSGRHSSRERRKTVEIIYTPVHSHLTSHRQLRFAMAVSAEFTVYWRDSCCNYSHTIQIIVEACHV